MLFNSIFRNVNVTLLCITNTEMGGWGTRPPLSEFSGSGPEYITIIARFVSSVLSRLMLVMEAFEVIFLLLSSLFLMLWKRE